MNSVSIVIAGNAPKLQAAVESAAAQTFPPLEIIVVEPSNRRLSSRLREALVRQGIDVIRLDQAASSAALRNAGVRASRGAWVGTLDPDDVLAPSFLADCAALSETAAVITSWSRVSDEAEVRSSGQEIDLSTVIGRPDLVHACSLFRREVWDGVGGFDEELPGHEMYDFWIRILTNGYKGAAIEHPLPTCRSSSPLLSLANERQVAAPFSSLFTKHRAIFARDLVSSLCRRDIRLEELRNRQATLHARHQAYERELRDLEGEVSGVTAALRGAGRDRVEWGDFHRTTPISSEWGADRGRCIDRYYIEQFLEARATDIRGNVLEVHHNDYTKRYGADRIRKSDVIDIDPTNPRATVIADLRSADVIPPQTYDCLILTQTLHVIYDVRAVLRECTRILKPAGVLLATLPFASRLAPEQGPDGDFWRFTASAARRLFEEFFAPDRIDVQSYGNVLVNIAFLYGLACHELTEREFETHDPYFPVVIGVRAQR
jgi:glycosyltransferase involved in cell wall biosynthesis